jgi:hypothetical protein
MDAMGRALNGRGTSARKTALYGIPVIPPVSQSRDNAGRFVHAGGSSIASAISCVEPLAGFR